MKYCPKCKTPVKAEHKFCTKCGERIIIEKEQQPTSPSISTQIYEKERQKEDLRQAGRGKNVTFAEKKKSNRGIYASIVIVASIFISVGAYYVLKENNIRNTPTLTQVPTAIEKEKAFEFPLHSKIIVMSSNFATISAMYPGIKKMTYAPNRYEIPLETDIGAEFSFKEDKLIAVTVSNAVELNTKDNSIERLSSWINSKYGSGEKTISKKGEYAHEEVSIKWILGSIFIEKKTFMGADGAGLITYILIEQKDKAAESVSGSAPVPVTSSVSSPVVEPSSATDISNSTKPAKGKYPEASLRLLLTDDLDNKSSYELKIMRNEIYARHGYIFKTDDMKRYFNSQPWYSPTLTDVSHLLSNIEKDNINKIVSREKISH